ncbi:MAG TPA: 2-amino-4-hydroxy-6-hydroxymethyldihydropteridine diphosphokinase [Caldilinea sp.]|nr:2-amino-4-hydroxy-6-hydroxymethyldihydropteridine diphosphokinase [Caldilinea sp.]
MEVLIALGSNIDRERNMAAAIDRLRAHPQMELVAVSPIYTTAAIGSDGAESGQPIFANAAARIATALPAAKLRHELRAMEAALGRVRTADKFAPRPIDLDIIFYGAEVLELDGHHIPDRDVVRFAHIALPAADIAGDWIHPETGQTLATIAAMLSTEELEKSR